MNWNRKFAASSFLFFFALASIPAFSQADDAKAELELMRHSIANGDYQMAFDRNTVIMRALFAELKQHPQAAEPAARRDSPATTAEFLAFADAIQKALDQGNWSWARDYSVQIGTALLSAYKKTLPTSAQLLAQLEATSAGATERERFRLLPKMSMTALDSGDLNKARQYSTELLGEAQVHGKEWPSGEAIHFGNIVAGRVALAAGDIESAKANLLAAGKTAGSPALNSFGPNMTLARDLLQKNDSATVIAYLDECRSFWKLEQGRLAKWIDMAQRGVMPDFGANLVYGSGGAH